MAEHVTIDIEDDSLNGRSTSMSPEGELRNPYPLAGNCYSRPVPPKEWHIDE